MKVAQNTAHRAQTAAGAQATLARGKCSLWDTEPQPLPLTPSIRRGSSLSMTKKKIKLLYSCASQPAALSSEDLCQLIPSPLLFHAF